MRAPASTSLMVFFACMIAGGRSAHGQAPTQPTTQAPPPAPVVRVGGPIKEPTKIKSVAPVYPDAAKQAGVQGVVILECTISPRGDVSEVKVLRGIPLLDQAAVDAVKQWVYTPTLLNGVPVPVIMTVTVNFKLSAGPLPAEAPPAAAAPTPTPAPVPTPTGSPEKIADIRRLLELNGSRAATLQVMDLMLRQVRERARPGTPPEILEALENELKAEHVEEWTVPFYDKYFTHEEIREYIRFYETPSGRKLSDTLPELLEETMALASARAPAVTQRLLERLRAGGNLKNEPRP